MDNTQLLKDIFNLAQAGIQVDLDNLPEGVSRDVVEKNLLYIQLKRLVKNNGDRNKIEEIKNKLNPTDKE